MSAPSNAQAPVRHAVRTVAVLSISLVLTVVGMTALYVVVDVWR